MREVPAPPPLSRRISESDVEDAALEWFSSLHYEIAHGLTLAPDGDAPERNSYGDVVLVERLRSALTAINPDIPPEAREQALRTVLRPESPSLIENNQRLHRLLTDGVDVEYRRPDGSVAGGKVWLFDFASLDNHDWIVVKQF